MSDIGPPNLPTYVGLFVTALLVLSYALLITQELLLGFAVVLLLYLAHLARRATIAVEAQARTDDDGPE